MQNRRSVQHVVSVIQQLAEYSLGLGDYPYAQLGLSPGENVDFKKLSLGESILGVIHDYETRKDQRILSQEERAKKVD